MRRAAAPVERRRSARRSTAAALVLLGLGLALALIPWPEPWVEHAFSRGLFPVTSHLLAPLVGAVPWSISGTLAALWLLAVAIAPFSAIGRRFVVRQLLPWSAAVLVLGFMLVWGLAYRRATLVELLRLPASTPTRAELGIAQAKLLEIVRSTAGAPVPGNADVVRAGRCVEAEVARVTGTDVLVPRRVKQLPRGTLLRLGFAGVTSPWLLEPHVDAGLPPVARLATSTHELTHTAGFAREADTDALAVLAGLRCRDPSVRYALALHALDLLLAAEPPQARRRLYDALPARAQDDLRAASRAAARFRVAWLERVATSSYGTYLRSRGVTAGMADYGRAITLVVQALAHGDT